MTKKVAIPVWENRVSPVMDTASRLMVVEIEDAGSYSHQVLDIPNLHLFHKIEFIRETKINLLICGAISKVMFQMVSSLGIEIVPFVRGGVEEIIEAYIKGELDNENFLLPGCPCRRRSRQHHRRNRRHCRSFKNRMHER